MRAIKFRAWHKKNQNMIQIFDSEHQTEWFLPNLSENYAVMQFTGLKDKNGKEIYEGDIVQYKQRNLSKAFGLSGEGSDDWIEKTKKIVYMEQGFNVPGGFIKDLEVIGNIFANPELQEGTQ